MGLKEEVKRRDLDLEQTRLSLEHQYSKYQHAVPALNQTIIKWIISDPEMRSLLDVDENERRVKDPIVGSKQLDSLHVGMKSSQNKVILEAQPLWPPLLGGAAGRVDLKPVGAAPAVSYYMIWDGQGESPNNWRIRSSDGSFDQRLNLQSLDDVLEKILLTTDV